MKRLNIFVGKDVYSGDQFVVLALRRVVGLGGV